MTEKKLRELEALIATKEVLRPSEVAVIWGIELQATTKYLNHFKEELARSDAKLPPSSLIYHSKKAQWVKRDAFNYFMDNYVDLRDEVARKSVPIYIKEVR